MSRPTLTQAHVDQLASRFTNASNHARKIDPATRGHISYPGMFGALQAILVGLVREMADDTAATKIDKALDDATSTEVPS